MAVWNLVKNYWKKSKEFASKHFSVSQVFVGLVTCVLLYCIWDKSRESPSTEVNSTTTTTTTSSQKAKLETGIIVYLSDVFFNFKVPFFLEGNGTYFCDTDTSTEAFLLAYESAKKFNQVKVPFLKQVAEYFNPGSVSFSSEANVLMQKIKSNIKILNRYPRKIRNNTKFEADFEDHLQILINIDKKSEELYKLSEQIGRISYDNLTISSLNLTQSCDAMKSELAKFPHYFKKITEIINSVSTFDVEIKKKEQIEHPEFTDDNEPDPLMPDKTSSIKDLVQEIEKKKSTIKLELDNIIHAIQQSKDKYQNNFIELFSLDSSYLTVPYLRRSVMYEDVLKFIKLGCDEYVFNHQQN